MQAAVSDSIRSVQTTLRHRTPHLTQRGETITRRLNAGQHLFFESDKANLVYRVTSGVLRLTRTQKDGSRQVIAFGFPGDVIGLPFDGRYTTECDAIIPTEVVARHYDSGDNPDRDPRLHTLLMTAALDRIRKLQDHFLILGRRRASEKVAAFLGILLDRIGEPLGDYFLIRLPMNRSDIADYLGLTPETVSRSITQFRADNLIALDDANTIIVRRPQKLRALAEGE